MLQQNYDQFCGFDCNDDDSTTTEDNNNNNGTTKAVCSKKEPHFFDDIRYEKEEGYEGYAKGYRNCNQIISQPSYYRLDATPQNLYFAQRIKKLHDDYYRNASSGGGDVNKNLWQDLKVIVSVREPVSRQLSLYNHQVSKSIYKNRTASLISSKNNDGKKKTPISFDEYVDEYLLKWWSETKNGNIKGSLYAQHLINWLKVIPRDRILILRYDELKENPVSIQNRISTFLNMTTRGTMEEKNPMSQNTYKVRLPSCKAQTKLDSKFKSHNEAFYKLLNQYHGQKHEAEESPFPVPFIKMDCVK